MRTMHGTRVVAPIRRVAVTIPARNEQDLLGSCLRSVMRTVGHLHTYRPDVAVEVFLVLDRCHDGSAVIARGYPVTVIDIDCGAVGAARDAAVCAALHRSRSSGLNPHSVWVASTDADTQVPTTWLLRQVELANSGADLVVGTVEPVDVDDELALAAWHARHELGEDHRHVHGANLGFRASTYLDVSGFGPVQINEDVGFVAKVRQSQARCVATDTTRVQTSGRAHSRVADGFASYLSVLTDVS